jgi:carbamoyl-phosphate synthase large subunit
MSIDRNAVPSRVLVSGVGGPAGLAVMKSLRDSPLMVYAADIDPYAAGLYDVPERARVLLPRGDDPGFVEFVFGLCRRERIDAVVPTVDSELLPLARARERFERAGVKLVLAPEATLRVCLDKWSLFQACAGLLRVPETVLVDEDFDPGSRELPVIAKPRLGSGGRGVRMIEHRSELERLPRDGTLIVQTYLPGPEYSLDVLANGNGQVLAVVPRSRLKVDSGIAVTGRTLHDLRLELIGRQVAELIGLTGVANVQVKADRRGAPALLEVNPRFPGSMSLTVASGVDMPLLCVAEALGAIPPEGPLPFADLGMVRKLEEQFFDPCQMGRLERRADQLQQATLQDVA